MAQGAYGMNPGMMNPMMAANQKNPGLAIALELERQPDRAETVERQEKRSLDDRFRGADWS